MRVKKFQCSQKLQTPVQHLLRLQVHRGRKGGTGTEKGCYHMVPEMIQNFTTQTTSDSTSKCPNYYNLLGMKSPVPLPTGHASLLPENSLLDRTLLMTRPRVLPRCRLNCASTKCTVHHPHLYSTVWQYEL